MSLESRDFEKFSLAQSLRSLDTGPIDHVIDSCESAFFDAGGQLEAALGSIRRLENLLPQLEAGLGATASEHLAQMIITMSMRAEQLSNEISVFSKQSAALKGTSDHLNNQIGDLDRVVRTIGTLAITARVIGHAMSPPEPKVAAFVENLSQMAVGAEEVLVDLKEAMSDIRTSMADQAEVVLELVETLENGFLLVMERLAASGEKAHIRSEHLRDVNSKIAQLMTETRKEVSKIIMALQVGDAVRQRFQRCSATLASLHEGRNIDHARLVLTLTQELISAARQHASAEVSNASAAIGDLEGRFKRAIRTVSAMYLDSSSSGMDQHELDSISDEMQVHIDRSARLLESLRQRSDATINRLQHILDSERTLRQIAHRVRLAGANAIVICTQLGQKGRALREVAQWLRAMTDEAEAVTAEMQKALATFRSGVEESGIESIARLSTAMRQVDETGREVEAQMHVFAKLVRSVEVEVREISVCFPLQLNHTLRRLSDFSTKADRLEQFGMHLLLSRAVLPPSPKVIEAGSEAEKEFSYLRSRYTMEAERVLHDKIIGVMLATALDNQPQPNEQQPKAVAVHDAPAAEAAEELDDIFF